MVAGVTSVPGVHCDRAAITYTILKMHSAT